MKSLRIALFAALASLLVSCGGGTGGTGVTSNTPSNAVSIGVMTKGSVIVNGVEFGDNNAKITIDDNSNAPATALQSGMVVRVRGQVNSNGTTGTAQVVNVSTEVRGTVQTHDATVVPPRFTVVGQTVFVDDLTVFANFGGTPTPAGAVGALVDNTSLVEVHGLRDAAGNIVASRVELFGANPPADELRGTVMSLSPPTFTLQNGTTNVTVNFSGTTTIVPSGTALANNQIVEVHGTFNSATFTATLINIEDDAQFQHQPGEEFSIEGQVSGCGAANPCQSFSVGNQAVQVNASTRFENGNAADVADGVRLEAEGHTFSNNTLIAEKIEFKRPRVILTGTATVTGTIPGTGTLQVLGKSVQITTFTDIRAQDGVISNGERVEVRGFVDSTGTIVAQRVDDSPSGNANRSILQAQVTAESGKILTMLGITADLNGTTQFEDENGPISPDTFFAAVTPATSTTPGTLVKVQGTFNSGTNTITVEEAELEDN